MESCPLWLLDSFPHAQLYATFLLVVILMLAPLFQFDYCLRFVISKVNDCSALSCSYMCSHYYWFVYFHLVSYVIPYTGIGVGFVFRVYSE